VPLDEAAEIRFEERYGSRSGCSNTGFDSLLGKLGSNINRDL